MLPSRGARFFADNFVPDCLDSVALVATALLLFIDDDDDDAFCC